MAEGVLWRGDPSEGIPHFVDDKTVKTRPYYGTTGGSGVRFRETQTGTALVYMPVDVADGVTLDYIQLRAECTKESPVKAELIAISSEGEVKSLGSVSTAVPGDGFFAQVRSEKMQSPVIVERDNFSYFVAVTLTRKDLKSDPAAFEVVVSRRCNPRGPVICPPGPEPEPLRPRPPIPPRS